MFQALYKSFEIKLPNLYLIHGAQTTVHVASCVKRGRPRALSYEDKFFLNTGQATTRSSRRRPPPSLRTVLDIACVIGFKRPGSTFLLLSGTSTLRGQQKSRSRKIYRQLSKGNTKMSSQSLIARNLKFRHHRPFQVRP